MVKSFSGSPATKNFSTVTVQYNSGTQDAQPRNGPVTFSSALKSFSGQIKTVG